MTSTEYLTAFLTARLDEDERELEKDPPKGLGYANLGARMRREIEAKRKILAEHLPIENGGRWEDCKICVQWLDDEGQHEFGIALPERWPCLTIRAGVIAVYSDHPAYLAGWGAGD